MELLPILHALGRRKFGALLIVLQIALTVGILANAISIVQQRWAHMRQPTGLDEPDIFTMSNQFTGPSSDLSARIQGDLAALRAIPGVVDAAAMQSFPLRGYGALSAVMLRPDQQQPSANVAEYAATPRAMRTLGVQLVAGREFTSDEVREFLFGRDRAQPAVAIVTLALARRLFPGRDALGRTIYLADQQPTRIVGIVQRAQEPWAAGGTGNEGLYGAELSIFVPYQWVSPFMAYVVRTRPGRCAALLPVAQQRLYAVSRARVLSEAQTFAETRAEQYRSDRALGLILGLVCVSMLIVTAMGIVALTTSWVTQRRRQIGMRRALGARRTHILRYVQLENLLITLMGAALGIALALGANLWLATSFAIARLSPAYLLLGALFAVALGQLAVLWPALRAASVPPALAARAP